LKTYLEKATGKEKIEFRTGLTELELPYFTEFKGL